MLALRDFERLYDDLQAGTNRPEYRLREDGKPWEGRRRHRAGLSLKSIRNLPMGLHAS